MFGGLGPPHFREALATLQRRQIVFELGDHGMGGVEVQMFRDGEFYAGRRFDTREQASAHAELVRGKLERSGWSLGEG